MSWGRDNYRFGASTVVLLALGSRPRNEMSTEIGREQDG